MATPHLSRASQWRNVTDTFKAKAATLQTGQLAHMETFTTYEAISALELMDPKMDAGLSYATNPGRVLSVDDALRRNLLKLDRFTLPELIGLLDEVMAAEVTWLEGQTLAQTVYTCMYVCRPDVLKDDWLSSACIGVQNTVEVASEIIRKTSVAYEEDIRLSQARAEIDIKMPKPSNGVQLLAQALESVERKINELPENDTEQKSLLDGIYHRLGFRQMWLVALLALSKPMKNKLQDAWHALEAAQQHLQSLTATVLLGVRPSAGENMIGFEPSLNYRQLVPGPVSTVNFIGRLEAVHFMENLIGQLLKLSSLNHSLSISAMLDFVDDFRQTVPHVLACATLNLICVQGGKWFGVEPLETAVKKEVQAFVQPPYLDPKFVSVTNPGAVELKVVALVDGAFPAVAETVGHTILTLSLNPARHHRALLKHLQHVAMVQQETEAIETNVHHLLRDTAWAPLFYPPHGLTLPLSHWLLCLKQRLMISYVESGCVLHLYSPCEMYWVYWCLDQLYDWSLQANCKAVSHSSLVTAGLAKKDHVCKRKGCKKKGRGREAQAETLSPSAVSLDLLQARQTVARGLWTALIGLELEKRLPKVLPYFDDEYVRFYRRFELLAELGAIQLLDHREAALRYGRTEPKAVYAEAAQCLRVARTTLIGLRETGCVMTAAQEKEIDAIEKVCKANAILFGLLANQYRPEALLQISHSSHPVFGTFACR